MFSKLKTSTQISLKFTAFSAGLLLIFSLMVNTFFFSSRYFGLNNYHPWISKEQKTWFQPARSFQKHELTFDLTPEMNELLEDGNFLWVVEKDEYYLYVHLLENRLLVRNITPQVEAQITLLWISLFVVVAGSLVSYLISLVFVKTALKKLNTLNRALEKLDIDVLDRKIEITGHPQDEINRVSKKFNQALDKILLQTQGLKDFVRNAAHELKTPLMAISSTISITRKSKDYEAGLAQIKTEIQRVDKLLETLLLITQLEEKIELKKEKTDLTPTIHTLIQQFQTQYQAKNLTLEREIPDQLEQTVNPEGWESIARNLIWNAFKFAPEKGTIRIHLSEKTFEVRNNGEAIAPEDLQHIWERFWQADSSHTDTKSFGLGLYLSKLFAQKQGFELLCQSKTEEWVRFILTFTN